jgi:3-deoxy-D-manno-octulosonic-acid transferase
LRYLYTLLLYLAVPLVLIRLYWRGRRLPDYRHRWAERFGLFPVLPVPGCIWVHAVSVGEVCAAIPLIRALQARCPAIPLLVTTTTPTGSQQVWKMLGDTVRHVYAPYDLPGVVARFLVRTRPRLLILMETELWPNLLRRCSRTGIPVLVANARLSAKSAQGYGRVAGLMAQMLADITLIAAQSEADAARFRALGAPCVQVMGNMKYDLNLPERLSEQGCELRRLLGEQRPIWIAASTHAGEEELVLTAFAQLRHHFPDLVLVLVPRHPERFPAVAELCRQQGLAVVKRSEQRHCEPTTPVFLGDSLGELLLFYAAADVAFVGGSLVPVGGHNVLEPALLGLPVVFGPHIVNFAEASRQLLEAQAAWQVANAGELAATVRRLLTDAALRQAAGRRSMAMVAANRGALEKLLGIIEDLL